MAVKSTSLYDNDPAYVVVSIVSAEEGQGTAITGEIKFVSDHSATLLDLGTYVTTYASVPGHRRRSLLEKDLADLDRDLGAAYALLGAVDSFVRDYEAAILLERQRLQAALAPEREPSV